MSPVRDLATAIRLLTIVPLGSVDGPAPARFFSVVGWLYGGIALAIVGAARAAGASEGSGALVVGALVVGAWAALSGLMHWDGLADSADGLGVRGDASRRLEAMRGSTVGAFGVMAIALVLVLQVSAVAATIERGGWWPLLAAPVVGRWAAGMALAYRAPARPDGLGRRYAHRDAAIIAVPMTLPAAALVAFAARPVAAAASLAVSLAIAAVLPAPFARRFGGITGDVLGATILLAETVVLVAGAFGVVPA